MKKFIYSFFTLFIALAMVLNLSAESTSLLDEDFESLTSGIPVNWERTYSSPWGVGWDFCSTDLEQQKCIDFDYCYAWSVSTGTLKSPVFSLPVDKEMILTFDYKNTNAGDFSIYLSTDGGSSWLDNVLLTGLKNQIEWKSMSVDLSAYAGQANAKLVFVAKSARNSLSTGVATYLDNVLVKAAPSCAQTQGFYATGLAQTTATVNWSFGSLGAQSTKFHVVVEDEDGTEILNNANYVTQSNSVALTSLTANTTYNVRVKTDCNDAFKDYAEWSETFTFTTHCNPFAVPYSNNFMAEMGTLPQCWMAGGGNAHAVMLSTEETVIANNDKSVKITSTVERDACIATPQIAHAANDLEIKFKVYGQRDALFMVAISSDITSPGEGLPVLTANIPSAGEWHEYVLQTTSLSTIEEDKYVMFYLPAGFNQTIYIDDVTVTELPTCIRPNDLSFSNLGTTSATFLFTTQAEQTANNYQLKITTEGVDEIVDISTSPYTHTTFTPNTNYTVTVRQICMVGDTSEWSLPISFKTYCEPITELPIFEGFEGENFPPDCWTLKQTKIGAGNGTDYGDQTWKISTYPVYAGGKCAHFQFTQRRNQVLLVMPYMTMPSDSACEVRFWLNRSNRMSKQEGVKVWIGDAIDTVGAEKLGYIANDISVEPTEEAPGWYQYTFPIPESVTGNKFVMIEGISENVGHTYIDNIEVRKRPACLAVKKLVRDSVTATNAYFSFTTDPSATATQWEVSYRIPGTYKDQIDTVTTREYVINNLSPNTSYTYVLNVRTLCSDTEVSEIISLKTTFRTECSVVEFPYFENFENNFNNSAKYCWVFTKMFNDSYPLMSDQTQGGFSKCMMTQHSTIFATPEIDLDTWVGKRVSVDVRTGPYNPNRDVYVGILSDPSDENTFVPIDTLAISKTQTTFHTDITNDYVGRRLAFSTEGALTTDTYAYFDNIKLQNTPQCPDVESVDITDITGSSALLTITDNINTAWEVVISPIPFSASTADTIQLTGKTHTFRNLNTQTSYELKIKGACSPTEWGNYSDPYLFTTPCNGFEVTVETPFFEGFEVGYSHGNDVGGCWSQEDLLNFGKWKVFGFTMPGDIRCPYEGSLNAFLDYGNEDYMIYPLELKAGLRYKFSCYARQEEGWSPGQIKVSISKNSTGGHSGTLIIDNDVIVDINYMEYTNDFSVLTDGVYYLKVGAKTYADKTVLDNIKVEMVACSAPDIATVTVNTLTTDSVSMQWINPATKYVVKVSTTSINPILELGNVYNDTVYAAEFNYGDLQVNTNYYYYIKSICGVGSVSDWSVERSFTTQCEAFDLPLMENFDTEDNNLSCWKSIGENEPSKSTAERYSGTRSLYCSGITLTTPEINMESLLGKQISTFAYSNIAGSLFSIGVMSDINDINTFEPLEDVLIEYPYIWEKVVVNFDSLASPDYSHVANAKYVVIIVSGDDMIYIDDIVIEDKPSCNEPSNISYTHKKDTAVTIGWAPGADETEWQVEVTQEAIEVLDTLVTQRSLVVNGLFADTDYDVKVRAICAEDDYSRWISSFFATECKPLFSLPFTEDFNDELRCWTIGKWRSYTGSLTPTSSYEFKCTGTMNASSLYTPTLDFTNVTGAVLEFDAMNATGGDLQVLTRIHTVDTVIWADTTFNEDQTVESIDIDTSYYDETRIDTLMPTFFSGVTSLRAVEVDLSKICGKRADIIFKGMPNYQASGDAYIRVDNINIYEVNTCNRPQSVTVSDIAVDSVNVTIIDESGATLWEYVVLEAGENIADRTSFDQTSEKRFTISGIYPATQYEVYVRTVCGEEKSSWMRSELFATPCGRLRLPYVQDFERSEYIEDVLCTDVIGANTETSMLPYAQLIGIQANVNTGNKALKLFCGTDSLIYFVLPEINASIDTVSMSFYYKNGGNIHNEGVLEVGLLPLNLDEEQFISLETYPITDIYTLADAEFAHLGLSGVGYRIAFRAKAGEQDKELFIDDIEVDYRSACVAPFGLEVVSIGLDSAKIVVEDQVNTAWDIAYGVEGTEFENLTIINNVADTITISDLEHSTEYEVYVRAVCGDNTTAWNAVTLFITECGEMFIDDSTPYIEDFQDYEHNKNACCWDVVQECVSTNFIYPAVYANSSAKALRFKEGPTAIALPKFTEPTNRLLIEFYAIYKGYLSTGGNIVVGYINDQQDVVDVFTVKTNRSLSRYNLDLTVLPAYAQNIVIRTLDGEEIEIDNVTVSLAPKCYTPNGVEIDSLTHESAQVRYLTSPNSVNVEYVLYKGATEIIKAWTEDMPIKLPMLDANTQYSVKFRSACSDNGVNDTTAWSAGTNFTTYQTPAALPYVETFEDAAARSMWNISGDGINQWIVSNKDKIAVKEGDYSLYISRNDSINEFDVLQTSHSWAYRTIKLDAGIYNFSCDFRNNGSKFDLFGIYLSPIAIDLSMVPLSVEGLIQVTEGLKYAREEWFTASDEVIVQEAGYYNLAFAWSNNESYGNQPAAAIDNIALSKQVDCTPIVGAEITALGSDYVTIVPENYNQTKQAYQVVVKTEDDPQLAAEDIAGAILVTTDTANLTNLNVDTQYYIYMRVICAVGDTSSWANAIEVHTKCGAFIVDANNQFVEGFESYESTQEVGGCWIQECISGDNSWIANVKNTEGTNIFGNREPRTGDVSATLMYGNTNVLKRDLFLSANQEYTVSVYARQNGLVAGDAVLTVGFLADPNNNASLQELDSKELLNGAYQHITGAYTPTEDGIYTLYVKGEAVDDAAVYNITIDDIMVLQECRMPYDVSVNNITANAAQIIWTSNADSTHIVVTGINYSLDTLVECVAVVNNLTIDNLQASKSYNVVLNNICGSIEGELYEIRFSTLCEVERLPYLEDFDVYAVGDLPACWDNAGGTAADNHKWVVADEGANKIMKFDSYTSAEGVSNILISPSINIDANDYTLSFDYKNPAGGAINAYLSTDAGLTYTDTIIDEAVNVSEWTNVSKPLGEYVGKELTLVIKSVSNAANGDAYHYLDNVNVSCFGGVRNIQDDICSNNAYINNGFSIPADELTVPGEFTFERTIHATSAQECDTTLILTLTVGGSYAHEVYDTICYGSVYNEGHFKNLTESDTYTYNGISITGCDSVVILYLEVLKLENTIDAIICEGSSYSFGGDKLTKAGTYFDTVPGRFSCDSIITLNLSIAQTHFEFTEEICEEESFEFNGKTYTKSGRYVDSLVSSINCDSILILNLTVHKKHYTINETICQGQSFLFDNEYLSKSGEYVDSMVNMSGCDSITTLTLIVTDAETTVAYGYNCENEEYYGNGFAGITITKDSVLYRTDKTVDGCDSIIELHLRFSPTVVVYDTVDINDGDVHVFCGNTYSTAGDYVCKEKTIDGCDSTIYLHLKVEDGVGLSTVEMKEVILVPNPTKANSLVYVNIDTHNIETVQILDAVGRVVYTERNVTSNMQSITVPAPGTSGVYYIRVAEIDGIMYVGKLIVK